MSAECELQINGGELGSAGVPNNLNDVRSNLAEREPFLVQMPEGSSDKLLVGNRMISVDHADSATSAENATNAVNAENAANATRAQNADSADKASKVVTLAIYNSLSDAQVDINNLEAGQLVFIKNIES